MPHWLIFTWISRCTGIPNKVLKYLKRALRVTSGIIVCIIIVFGQTEPPLPLEPQKMEVTAVTADWCCLLCSYTWQPLTFWTGEAEDQEKGISHLCVCTESSHGLITNILLLSTPSRAISLSRQKCDTWCSRWVPAFCQRLGMENEMQTRETHTLFS